jgi:hypothetical protein
MNEWTNGCIFKEKHYFLGKFFPQILFIPPLVPPHWGIEWYLPPFFLGELLATKFKCSMFKWSWRFPNLYISAFQNGVIVGPDCVYSCHSLFFLSSHREMAHLERVCDIWWLLSFFNHVSELGKHSSQFHTCLFIVWGPMSYFHTGSSGPQGHLASIIHHPLSSSWYSFSSLQISFMDFISLASWCSRSSMAGNQV